MSARFRNSKWNLQLRPDDRPGCSVLASAFRGGRRLEDRRPGGDGVQLLLPAKSAGDASLATTVTDVLDGATFKDGIRITNDETIRTDEEIAA